MKVELRHFIYIYIYMTFFVKKKLILLKLYSLVLDVKLLIKHVIFFFLKNFIDTKNLTKIFTSVDVID